MHTDTLWADIRLAGRLALRELRGSLGDKLRRFGVFLTCLALGVGAVAGVGSLSAALDAGLGADAKRLLGGDLEIRLSHREMAPEPLDFVESRGAVSRMVRMRAMARPEDPAQAEAEGVSPASLVELKAVDGAYPLFGEAELEPIMDLEAALAQQDGEYGAVAEKTLMARLGLEVGDAVNVGRAVFRIRAVLEREPDRPGNFFGLGPRLMIALPALEQTGLVAPGSVVYYYYRLRLGGAEAQATPAEVEAFRDELNERFPEAGWRIRVFTSAGGGLERSLDNLAVYLTLVGLASLLVGGIGAANGVRGYLASKTTVIASMKCLGAGRRLVLIVYLFQTLILAGVGSVLGLVLGAAAANAGAVFLAERLQMSVLPGVYPAPLAVSLVFGLLVAAVFSLPALSAAGAVSPARLWRGYGDPSRSGATRRAKWAVAGLSAALLLIAWGYTAKPAIVAGFAVSVIAAAALFRLCAWAIMRLAARIPRPRTLWLAHGLQNLHRPGSATPQVVFSLGLGLTVLAVVTQAQGNLTRQIEDQIPEDAPSFFFIDIPESRIDPLVQMLRTSTGVSTVEYEPSLRGRIVKINGVPAEQVEIDPDVQWALRGDRGLTYAAEKPDDVKVTAGSWWPPDYDGPPQMCLTEGIARGFGLTPGDTLTVNLLGREVTAAVNCFREVDWSTLSLNHAIIFAPGTLENAPKAFIATAYVDEDRESDVFRRVAVEFPEVVAIYLKDVLLEVADLLSNIGAAVQATAGVTLLAGLLVLAETLRAALRSRRTETVVLKVLGATRRDVVLTLVTEFTLLGLAAALVSALLGSVIAWVFVRFVMEIEWALLPGPLAAIVLGGAAATLVLGLAHVHLMLGQKSWPVLRNE